MKDRYVLALAAILALLLTLPLRPWFPWWGELLFLVLSFFTLEALIEWAYKRNRSRTLGIVGVSLLLLVVVDGFIFYRHITPPLSISMSNDGIELVGPYSYLPDSPGVAPGKDFDATQKQRIVQENRKKNGGVVRSDLSGRELAPPQQHTQGTSPPPDEWQIDHICPKSFGGTNSYANAQVLARSENRIKFDDAALCPR